MYPEPWLYAVLGSLVAVDVGLLLYTYRDRTAGGGGREVAAGDRRSDADPEPDADPGLDAGGETIRCRDCGAENDRGYRFCRRCVAELPGQSVGSASAPTPSSRGLF